jgi:hypothetical protein
MNTSVLYSFVAGIAYVAITNVSANAQGHAPSRTGPDPATAVREAVQRDLTQEFTSADEGKLFSPELYSIWSTYLARHPGDFDADPFCGCQDSGGMSIKKLQQKC